MLKIIFGDTLWYLHVKQNYCLSHLYVTTGCPAIILSCLLLQISHNLNKFNQTNTFVRV